MTARELAALAAELEQQLKHPRLPESGIMVTVTPDPPPFAPQIRFSFGDRHVDFDAHGIFLTPDRSLVLAAALRDLDVPLSV